MEDYKLKNPVTLDISLTSSCNLNCSYCYNARERETISSISYSDLDKIENILVKYQVLQVVISGGEPFLYPYFNNLIDIFQRTYTKFVILTNGTVINKNIIQKIADNSILLKSIQISLDSIKPDINGLTRGKGTLEKTLLFMDILENYGLQYEVRVTLTRWNINSLIETASYLKKRKGCKRITVNEFFCRGNALNNYNELDIPFENLFNCFQEIMDFNSNTSKYLILTDGIMKNMETIYKIRNGIELEKKYINSCGILGACNHVYSGLSILHNGDIVPCMQLSNLVIGNIKNSDLLKLWQSNPILIKLRERKNISLKSFIKCNGCFFIKYCNGGCPAISIIEGNTFDDPVERFCLNNINPESV